MALSTLKDLYIDQLQDIYSANRQAQKALGELRDAATNDNLRSALDAALAGTKDGTETIAEIVRSHDADPTDEFCKGMEGLVKEARAHALEADFDDDAVRDAMIITQVQRMTHYGIAGYGCLAAFANRLDLANDASRIETCLDNTYDGDRTMSAIAKGGINKAAAA